jgi:DNA polymerase-3 subunit gamma/tau
MYQVLARKCRPQTFDELVGQPHVARTLTNAISSDRLAHAYIFAGLRGTGKTTVARILAKCLNCETGPTTTPFNTCDACREISESRAIDVLEVDAASRTKVDQTRELLEVVSYAPVRDRFKVLIIDEAHMLSKSSFNALLKTLEEPPPNVVFVLATTELQKILPTILSRCQVFEFRRVAPAEVTAHLRGICDRETIVIPDAALERLARAGEGSVRDSLSLLERALAFCGTEIAEEDVLRMLGAVRAGVLTELVTALAARDAAGMLRVLDGLVDEGHDLVHFWNAVISAVRDLLILRTLPDDKELLARPADEAEALAAAAEELSREDLMRVFQILADLEPGLKASSQPRFLWEATLIRLASLGAVRPIEEVLGSLGDPAPAPAGQKKKHGEARPARARKPPVAAEPAPATSSAIAAPASAPVARSGNMARLIESVSQARPMLGAMLEQAAVELHGDRLCVRFPPGMEAVKRQIETRQSVTLLRGEAEKLGHGRLEIRVELGEVEAGTPRNTAPGVTASEPEADSAPEPPSATPAPRTEPSASTPRRAKPDDGLLDQAKSEPGVQKLLDAFGAHVVDIRRHDAPQPVDGEARPSEDVS